MLASKLGGYQSLLIAFIIVSIHYKTVNSKGAVNLPCGVFYDIAFF